MYTFRCLIAALLCVDAILHLCVAIPSANKWQISGFAVYVMYHFWAATALVWHYG
jgi:hypothetical protein